MKYVVAGLAGLLIVGCGNSPEPQVQRRNPPAPPGAAQMGPGDGITPVGPTAGPMTPVAGGENLGGTTGGGVAQAAKDRARGLANQSSTAQPTGAGDSDE